MNHHLDPTGTIDQIVDDLTPSSTAISIAKALRARIIELQHHRAVEREVARCRYDAIAEQVHTARHQYDAWLDRHFLKTAEAAELLGMSPRLLQGLAAEGPVILPTPDGRVVEVNFRTMFHGGYWFARDDVDRILQAQRARR
jgi:hypothetical protein